MAPNIPSLATADVRPGRNCGNNDDDCDGVKPSAFNVRDTAKLLGVSPATVWKMLALKQLRAVHILGCTRVPVDEIKRLLTPEAA